VSDITRVYAQFDFCAIGLVYPTTVKSNGDATCHMRCDRYNINI